MEVLLQAFIAEGHKPAVVDAETRAVHTAWSEPLWDNCPHLTKRNVQRYTAVLLPMAGDQVSATVRLDQYCCEDGRKVPPEFPAEPRPHASWGGAFQPSGFDIPEPVMPAIPEGPPAGLVIPEPPSMPAVAEVAPSGFSARFSSAGQEGTHGQEGTAPQAAASTERPALPRFNPNKEDPTASEKCVRHDAIRAEDQRALDALGAALQQHLQRAAGAEAR
jgi:hypothetical protein